MLGEQLGQRLARRERRIRTDANGDATAEVGRWVSTVTSLIPSADSARTAPRAVAPKLITAAFRRRP